MTDAYFIFTPTGKTEGHIMDGKNQTIKNSKQIMIIMAGVMLGLFLAALDGTIVSTVMPIIASDLNGMQYYTWPFAVYMLTSTVSVVIFGKCSDQFGRKGIFIFGIGVFIAGSVLCGISTGIIWLILARGLQGIGGGILTSLAFIIVAGLFPIYERGKYMGILASVFGVASVAGPVMGGFIAEALGWRWTFFINLPLGLAAALIIHSALPETTDAKSSHEVDCKGIACFTGGMVPLFIAVSCGGTVFDWTSVQVTGMLAISLILIALFIRIERRAANPIIPLHFFRKSVFTYTAAAAFTVSAIMSAGTIYLPLFMQDVQKIGAGASGLVITPMVLALVAASTAAGRLISSTRRYKPVAVGGFATVGAGALMLSTLNPASPLAFIVAASILLGLGIGTMYPALVIAAQTTVSVTDIGAVISLQQFFRNMGSTLLTPVFGFIMYEGLGPQPDKNSLSLLPPEIMSHAIQLVFISCILLAAAAMVLMLRLEDVPLKSKGC
ncbi:EmrB/QacA subfamily drug resistance transporter [Methanomicrobium sp. W14]|uniref:MDR family MFS transporter n=1 Tax=Methanomicrobium sp. W14 TaxID=2817839 RepID=UPI001AE9A6E9|nr:MDR family MFS transporter [Methanomicrobium sp. W14]MBP2132387.1 EmrB/QacA subfamily drug resistance transporter [Methanomicrobium sp. W14]